MNKFLVYFLMMFLLVLVGGAYTFGDENEITDEQYSEFVEDEVRKAFKRNELEFSDQNVQVLTQSIVLRGERLSNDELRSSLDSQMAQFSSHSSNGGASPVAAQNEFVANCLESQGSGGVFSRVSSFFTSSCEEQYTNSIVESYQEGVRTNTEGVESMEEFNSINNEYFNIRVSSLDGFENFNECSSFDASCREAINNHNCEGNEACELSRSAANELLSAASDNQRIPASGMIRAAQMLRITPQASAASSMIQDLLGIEVSLIQEGSGIDQILRYGTPEQICFAKVDSFISVNGLQVEGQVMEVDDEITGMSSVLRACDNRNFQICADLRAERSGIYFNNSFTLFVHVFVRNAEDFPQMVTLHAELKSGGGREERVNVVELSEDVPGKFILLSPGQTFSRTLYLPETQVFMGEELKELYGNIVMGVFEAVGVSEQLLGTSSQSSNSGPDLSNIDVDSLTDEELSELMIEIERNENPNQDAMDSASQGGLVYALDYPILTLRGSSGSNIRKEVEMSGANITSGTTQQSIAVVRRVSLD